QRGLPSSAGLVGGLLSQQAASLPLELAVSTVSAASQFAAGTGVVPTSAASLAEGVLDAMSATKLKIASVLLVVLALLGVGAGALTYGALAAPQADAKNEPSPAPGPTAQDPPREDKDQLQGTWTVIAYDRLGQPASKEFLARKHQWRFAGDKVTLGD